MYLFCLNYEEEINTYYYANIIDLVKYISQI